MKMYIPLSIWLLYLLTKMLAWTLVRGVFNLVQWVWWLFNGTNNKIQSCCKETSYEGSVQVMDILLRHKFDYIGQPSGRDNFISCHNCFVDPEYVLDDSVTLYYVNKREAIWVEVEKGVEPSRSQYAAFLRLAQWKLAKKLIVMPIHIFHKLGDKIGKPKAKIIFLANTARCGSTMVTRVFSETNNCLAYSEPDCLNAITQVKGQVSEKERDRIFINSINLLCKPFHARPINTYLLKPTQPSMVEFPHIKKLFPDSILLFLYRDGLAVSQSVAKCSYGVPIIGLVQVLGRWSSKFTKQMVDELGLPSEQFEQKLQTDIHFGAIMWAAAMRQYLDFRQQGFQIDAIRYEDIRQDANFAFQKIFEYCGVEFNSNAVEVGMSEDSQRASPISSKKTQSYRAAPYSAEAKLVADMVCDQFKVPRFDNYSVAPGTITAKSDQNRDNMP